MKNESPLPQAPSPPREIPFKKAMAYSGPGLLLGSLAVADGLITAAIFHFVALGLPAFVSHGLPGFLIVAGLVCVALAFRKIQRRKKNLEDGRCVTGRVLACDPAKGWNPPPWVVTFEAEDPMSGQTIQGKRWFQQSNWRSLPPQKGQDCLVAVDEGMNQRMELLAVEGWQAWED